MEEISLISSLRPNKRSGVLSWGLWTAIKSRIEHISLCSVGCSLFIWWLVSSALLLSAYMSDKIDRCPGAGSVSAQPWVMENGQCISEEKVCFCRKSRMSALRLAKTTILQGGWQSGWRELKHVMKWSGCSSSHQRWLVISLEDVCCFSDKVVWLCLLKFVHLAWNYSNFL